MQRLPILGLQAVIVLLGVLTLVVQYGIVAVGLNEPAGRVEWVSPALVVGAVLFVVCTQVVLVCVWALLRMVAASRIFSERAFRYVDIIAWALFAATALVGLLFLLLIWLDKVVYADLPPEQELPPGFILLVLIAGIVGTGLTLLVVVMRGLLRQASQLERDLSEVV